MRRMHGGRLAPPVGGFGHFLINDPARLLFVSRIRPACLHALFLFRVVGVIAPCVEAERAVTSGVRGVRVFAGFLSCV